MERRHFPRDDARASLQNLLRLRAMRGGYELVVLSTDEGVLIAASREDRIARRVAAESRDLPAGTVGREDVSRQLRALDQRRTVLGFEQIALVSDYTGRLVTVGDVARDAAEEADAG